jgi:hypothetical protein
MIRWKKILDIPDCKRVVKEHKDQEVQDMQTVTPCPPPTEDFLNWQGLTLDQLMQIIKL